MIENIKRMFFFLWSFVSKVLPETTFLKQFDQKIFMAKLFRDDPIEWRVRRAREMGAKVGKECRFYSLNFFSEPYLIEIGNNVIISGNVTFVTHDGGVFLLKDEIPNINGHYGQIKIGNNCFIGMGAIILPNVTIGNNCIIGAGSVITKDFPDDSVIMGNPAKVIFNTKMYKRMKKNSVYTVTNDEYIFPLQFPEQLKRDMLLKHFANIPEKKTRRKKNNE